MTADSESQVTCTMADQGFSGGNIDDVLRQLQPRNVIVPPKSTHSEPKDLAGEYLPSSVPHTPTPERASLVIKHPRDPLSIPSL